MKHPNYLPRSSAALLLTSLVAACGGGSTPASTNITSGIASKGPLNGAKVCAYTLTTSPASASNAASTQQGAPIGTCATTDTAGNYSIDLGPYTGPVLFTVEGGSYIDEATGNKTPLSLTLHSLVANATGGPMSVAITPLTELAYQNALAKTGGLSTANIQIATASVQNNFGIADITGTQPVDALKLPANATEAQKNYTLALAGISQYLNNQPGTSLASVLSTLQTCLAAPTTGCGSGATSVGANLSTAFNTFTTNHSAYAGLTGSTGRVAFFGSVTAAPSNGLDGATGAAGAAGATGATGATGAAGATGTAGAQGTAGSNGTNGSTGPRGAIGAEGPTGPAGPGVTWVNVTGTTQAAAANKGYMANNASLVTLTLPLSTALTVGDVIQVNGVGAGGWTIVPTGAQSIITQNIPGSLYPSASASGSISGGQYAAIELQYVAADTFSVLNSAGRLAVVGTALTGGYVFQGGLTWMPVTGSPYSYGDAVALCASTINSLTGWRLPTRDELNALYTSQAMTGQGWVLNSYTWASTPNGSGFHYVVSLASGAGGTTLDTNLLYVTCVR